jgi:hypothetical protein
MNRPAEGSEAGWTPARTISARPKGVAYYNLTETSAILRKTLELKLTSVSPRLGSPFEVEEGET